jgi:hypothetical protein
MRPRVFVGGGGGGSLTVMVTEKDAEDWLPAASDAVQVTVCVPTASALPEGGTQVTATGPSTTSSAVGSVYVTVVVVPSVSSVMLAGTLAMTGAVVSVQLVAPCCDEVPVGHNVALVAPGVGT